MKLVGLILVMAAVCASTQAAEVARVKDVGPRTDDAQFLGMLNLEYPGLEKVRAAIESGDLNVAKHELAEHFRNREKPTPGFDWKARPKYKKRPDGVDTREADRVMDHDLVSVSHYHKYQGEIDWTLNPINYREWPWQLSRHHIWVQLARAYWATGEEKYAKEFAYQMQHWVRNCPVPLNDSGNRSETWRTIEAGIRMGQTWPEVFYRFLTSPSFDDEAVVTMVKSMVEHAQHLMKWPTTANWLTMETNGLMHVGVLFPEFREAEDWRKTAIERMYVELDKQVYPDGAQIELATGYHQVSLNNFVGLWKIAHVNDIEMPRDYVAKLQKMYDYNLNASMPNGYLPGLNDAGNTNIRGSLKQAHEYFPERKDYQWMATNGKEGTKPEVGSIALPFSGHIIMRTGWDPDDLYMLFDAGPFGYGHQHEDALSIVLYAYGKYMLVDPGNYPYDSSDWRKYVLSTRAHNTVMVDGCEQHRRGRPRERYVLEKPMAIKWASNENCDYAKSVYADNYASDNSIKVRHRRSVFFVKPEYWIVVDTMTPADRQSHKYDGMFHLDMSGATIDERTKSVSTTDAKGANLTIFPMADGGLKVRVASGEKEPMVQGWIREGAYGCRPIPTPIFSKEQSGVTRMAYVLYPTPEGKKCPIVKLEPVALEGADGVGLAIDLGGGRVDYYVECDSDYASVKFGDYTATGQVTYIRTENGRVTSSIRMGGRIDELSNTPVRHKF